MLANLVRKIKYLFALFLDWLSPKRRKPTGIMAETEEALQEWKHAREALNYADKEMIDFAILNVNSSEKKYVGLWQKARKAGLRAWELER